MTRCHTRWYNFETLPQTDDFRLATVESAHIVQSVHAIARLEAKMVKLDEFLVSDLFETPTQCAKSRKRLWC